MGNSGSGQTGTGVDGKRGWAHSYPRPAHKVLPERVPGQRLRLTHNGNILHSGGTLTGRKHSGHQIRPRSSSQGSQYEPTKVLYGSEPDLRFTGRDFQNCNDSPAKLRISRSRKKYKAPPAPQNNNGVDSSSPDSYHHWEMNGGGMEVVPPVRRLRLFKTKAESNKRRTDEQPSNPQPLPSPGPLQRSLSSPQFQLISPADLLEAAEKLRPVREPPIGKAADSPILRSRENFNSPIHNETSPKTRLKNNNFKNSCEPLREVRNNFNNTENKSNYAQRIQRSSTPKDQIVRVRSRNNRKVERGEHRPRGDGGEVCIRGEGSIGKESTPEPVQRKNSTQNHEKRFDKAWAEIKPTTKPTAPVKTFYFGMNEEDLNMNSSGAGSEDNQEVERFAARIQRRIPTSSPPPHLAHLPTTSGSNSLSSDPVCEESSPKISLQLRPILPRKQLDIPRFSPTAAWRLLSALESPPPSEEDDLVALEDRIPAPLPHYAPPHHLDKSGDSGISGDASPHNTHNSQAAWTPQQDLEETSSDGGLESAPLSPESLPLVKFSPRFSLSLPRDDRLAVYTQSDKKDEDSFHSLKKLKRSMSGALGRCGGKESNSLPLDNNWVLSRSVPNSLNTSLQRWSSSSPSSPDQEDELSLVKQPSFSYLATGGHVMYLPEYSTPRSCRERERTPAGMTLSKSCEDLSQKEEFSPAVIRALEPRTRNGRKFTFQSTVRQIERRRLAEKLSKEAEQKERQRLNELEAMRRVEEEFQRKREREKADIRHQLRLYSLTQGRAQPDGIDAPPPPATQVLSEFRQPRRDYRDYTPHRYQEEPVAETTKRSTVHHPQVVYQMPKSTQVYVTPHLHSNSGSGVGSNEGGERGGMSTPRSSSSDNYRRDFAQGALPHSLVSSDSEVSQPNTRPTSRNLHRSRSASPGYKSPRVVSPAEITLHLKQLKILQLPASPNLDFDCELQPSSLDTSCSEQPATPPPQVQATSAVATGVSRLGLSALAQPFVRSPKSFRPIAFNPTPSKVAQIAI